MSSVEEINEEQRKEAIRENEINSLLSIRAKERLGHVELVRPDRARRVGDMIINMARKQEIGAPVDEDAMIRILDQTCTPELKPFKVIRRVSDPIDNVWDADVDGW